MMQLAAAMAEPISIRFRVPESATLRGLPYEMSALQIGRKGGAPQKQEEPIIDMVVRVHKTQLFCGHRITCHRDDCVDTPRPPATLIE